MDNKDTDTSASEKTWDEETIEILIEDKIATGG